MLGSRFVSLVREYGPQNYMQVARVLIQIAMARSQNGNKLLLLCVGVCSAAPRYMCMYTQRRCWLRLCVCACAAREFGFVFTISRNGTAIFRRNALIILCVYGNMAWFVCINSLYFAAVIQSRWRFTINLCVELLSTKLSHMYCGCCKLKLIVR